MGANCCVAARDKPLPDRISRELSSYRNVRNSPSWSFRWDNRTHIEDIMDNPSRFSQHNSGNISSESKSGADIETEGLSDGGSPSFRLQTPKLRKKLGSAGSSKSAAAGQLTRSNFSAEEKGTIKSSTVSSSSDVRLSLSIPSTPSSSSFKVSDPSPSSRKARRSPGYPLSRQVSDSRIPSLKSLNESSNCSPEGRPSFVLSTGGSHGGSSDGWSMRTFTELVAASSQRDPRWSLDSENTSSNSKTERSYSSSSDPHTCRVCSKLLKEKSPWSAQKIVSTNELAVAAVLICGHVYHADCLDSITSEHDRYDPPCPLCTNNEKLTPKLKARSKISRRAVADIDVHGECRKSPSMGASLSMKRPFLKRHFSIGSHPVSENETTRRKKGFWSRSRRD
ncbi:uncharacterized protein A4U43_C01F26940 [Asparagus officinalis]|uniref:RING-type domain-containing protein n=1 Tax=Asparagus officinalis TaxID=4686 RepID=A0A5P1FSF1_ASPOF|nr:uncharacterized protein LOC109828924 [Asparagus officinalis]XP_020251501.1 uncharacterized protein LOC109828924 [Asparagus officinalis]XP_020251502.1 uncharacterized protein LOC109828924 [Asparagus officinalis]XP_020251504.1 uncharacterized protein LOC109828924 [Asparagus officinalis]XP_020251505.1 uncharacterized protein LOC109828924 [Asparagus officinalis]XP_020251506.1 uncharacterized protein LOC109828924 [Asparagus officinalis]ONK81246.1 uncharacterized protein A4U43_C01F26940 [Asparag